MATAEDVLNWMDTQSSRERRAADAYRRAHDLPAVDRCVYCGAKEGGVVCAEADRAIFSCSNYRGK